MRNYAARQIEDSYKIKKSILDSQELMDTIVAVSERAVSVYRNSGKVLLAGNGGSAADAQHIAGEFVSKLYFDRPGLSSFALTTDTSILTAIGNDYGFATLFARQVQANGNSGDMFIGISTSGNSKNILEALQVCKEKGIISVGLTGQSGGKMPALCDYCIQVPSDDTPRIQESHIMIGHIMCAIVEEAIFGKGF